MTLHTFALFVLSHPILTLAVVWALLAPLMDYLPEHRR